MQGVWSCVATTEAAAWQTAPMYKPAFSFEQLNLNIQVPASPVKTVTRAADGRGGLTIDSLDRNVVGFGACLNELGWTSLGALSDADRESVMREFFDPVAGARFSYCRMPIGANDFAREAYS